MTYRAGNSVCGDRILLGIFVEGQVRENFAETALQLGFVTRDGHVAVGATIFDDSSRFGMVQILAPHAGLPVRVARRIRHGARAPFETDRYILARWSREAVVTGQTAIGGLEPWL
jgi:hypothetical protein